uniref:RAD51-associated protein 2 n=1 Tax=Myxine glutinosa TaxID=7769 RepID=UPI00358F91E2
MPVDSVAIVHIMKQEENEVIPQSFEENEILSEKFNRRRTSFQNVTPFHVESHLQSGCSPLRAVWKPQLKASYSKSILRSKPVPCSLPSETLRWKWFSPTKQAKMSFLKNMLILISKGTPCELVLSDQYSAGLLSVLGNVNRSGDEDVEVYRPDGPSMKIAQILSIMYDTNENNCNNCSTKDQHMNIAEQECAISKPTKQVRQEFAFSTYKQLIHLSQKAFKILKILQISSEASSRSITCDGMLSLSAHEEWDSLHNGSANHPKPILPPIAGSICSEHTVSSTSITNGSGEEQHDVFDALCQGYSNAKHAKQIIPLSESVSSDAKNINLYFELPSAIEPTNTHNADGVHPSTNNDISAEIMLESNVSNVDRYFIDNDKSVFYNRNMLLNTTSLEVDKSISIQDKSFPLLYNELDLPVARFQHVPPKYIHSHVTNPMFGLDVFEKRYWINELETMSEQFQTNIHFHDLLTECLRHEIVDIPNITSPHVDDSKNGRTMPIKKTSDEKAEDPNGNSMVNVLRTSEDKTDLRGGTTSSVDGSNEDVMQCENVFHGEAYINLLKTDNHGDCIQALHDANSENRTSSAVGRVIQSGVLACIATYVQNNKRKQLAQEQVKKNSKSFHELIQKCSNAGIESQNKQETAPENVSCMQGDRSTSIVLQSLQLHISPNCRKSANLHASPNKTCEKECTDTVEANHIKCEKELEQVLTQPPSIQPLSCSMKGVHDLINTQFPTYNRHDGNEEEIALYENQCRDLQMPTRSESANDLSFEKLTCIKYQQPQAPKTVEACEKKDDAMVGLQTTSCESNSSSHTNENEIPDKQKLIAAEAKTLTAVNWTRSLPGYQLVSAEPSNDISEMSAPLLTIDGDRPSRGLENEKWVKKVEGPSAVVLEKFALVLDELCHFHKTSEEMELERSEKEKVFIAGRQMQLGVGSPRKIDNNIDTGEFSQSKEDDSTGEAKLATMRAVHDAESHTWKPRQKESPVGQSWRPAFTSKSLETVEMHLDGGVSGVKEFQRVVPLKTCKRPIRLGLSRKAKIAKLHSYLC